MFTIIIVAIMSLVMWVLGASMISQEISRKEYPGKLLAVILSVPIIPWLKAINWDWQTILISAFFYVLSILGIISIFYI
jgi:hypothetical protein